MRGIRRRVERELGHRVIDVKPYSLPFPLPVPLSPFAILFPLSLRTTFGNSPPLRLNRFGTTRYIDPRNGAVVILHLLKLLVLYTYMYIHIYRTYVRLARTYVCISEVETKQGISDFFCLA